MIYSVIKGTYVIIDNVGFFIFFHKYISSKFIWFLLKCRFSMEKLKISSINKMILIENKLSSCLYKCKLRPSMISVEHCNQFP